MRLRVFLSCIACFLTVSPVAAEDAYWRTRPGGLAAIDYLLPVEPVSGKQRGYYNIDFSFTVRKDPGNELSRYPIPEDVRPSDTIVGYYWANQFAFVNGSSNGVDGYMGLQTVGQIYSADPEHRQDASKNRFVKSTRIAIFSIWKALDGRPVGNRSYAAPFGHEGAGWSCKVEFPWREGVTYAIRIWELADAGKPDDPEWWRACVTDKSTGVETVIGDILVPGSWGWLRRSASMFTEYYSMTVNQAVGDADDGRPNPRVGLYMPKAVIDVEPPRANAGTVRALRLTVRNYGKCAGVSSWRTVSGRPLASGESVSEAVRNLTGSLERAK